MLCTLVEPSGGSALVAGHDVVTERDAVRRNIGLVFQDTTLDGYLTAEQNLRLHAELYGVPREVVAPRMQQVMEMVGLWERRDEPRRHVLRRYEAATGDRARATSLAARAVPRRADRRPRPADAQLDLGTTSPSSRSARTSRSSSPPTTWTRPSTAIASRSWTRDASSSSTARRAEGQRRHRPRPDPDAGQRCRHRRPTRALRARGHRRRGRRHLRRTRGRAVRPAPVRRARTADPSRLVSRPSLDDVFMSYTGTTIRDAEATSTDRHAQRRAHDGPLMVIEIHQTPPGADTVRRTNR